MHRHRDLKIGSSNRKPSIADFLARRISYGTQNITVYTSVIVQLHPAHCGFACARAPGASRAAGGRPAGAGRPKAAPARPAVYLRVRLFAHGR